MDSKEEEEEEDVMVVEIFRSSQEKLKRQKFRFRSLVDSEETTGRIPVGG